MASPFIQFFVRNGDMELSAERIQFVTADGVEIVGDYYAPLTKCLRGILMLHMMPETRDSFAIFARKTAACDFHVLAIDLRGHGESIKRVGSDSVLDYKSFSDADHQKSINDIRAAIFYLRGRGVKEIGLVGASIGANLSLQAIAEDQRLKGAILLSPGYNYRGIETIPFVRRLSSGQRVFFVGSEDDGNAVMMVHGLFSATPERVHKNIKVFQTGGHGTEIFEQEPLFIDECISWLSKLFER